MANLPQLTLNFNRRIKLTADGGSLSSDSGLLAIREFDEKIGFSRALTDHLSIEDRRSFFVHSNEQLVVQKLYQIIAGYPEDDAADQLTHDPVFREVVETSALASQPSLSRFLSRFTGQNLDQLESANRELLDRIHRLRKAETLVVDLDSTHSDTFGRQENTAYNTHYGTVGYHPLVAFDGLTGDFLKARLRPGNVYTSNGTEEFLRPIIQHYNQEFPSTSLMVRGDSGFAVPEIYTLCEGGSVSYIIRLKSNKRLQALAEELHPSGCPQDVSKSECLYADTLYQAGSWERARRVVIRSERPAGELFFRHTFLVTSFGEGFHPTVIVSAYQKRGTMENFIKEAKGGFAFDRMVSHDFLKNEVRMMFSLLAYNLVNWMRTLVFPEGRTKMQIHTIRTRLIKAACRTVKSARSLHFRVSSSFVYLDFFWKVMGRIRALQIE